MAENIKFGALTFNKPGRYHYTIKELSSPGHGWAIDKRVFRVTIVVVDNQQGQLVCSAEYPDGKPQFVNVFSCAPARVRLCAKKNMLGLCAPQQCKHDGRFLFGLFNEKNEVVETAQNVEGMIVFPCLEFKQTGLYRYTMKELTQPLCSCWRKDESVFPVEINVKPSLCGTMQAKVRFPHGEPIFNNTFSPCCGCLPHTHAQVGERLEKYECSLTQRAEHVFDHPKEKMNDHSLFPPIHAQVECCAFRYYQLSGAVRKGQVLLLTFPHSNTGWIQVMPSASPQYLLESLGDIFAHIGGVPQTIRFASTSICIASENLRLFAACYGFVPELWQQRRPQNKVSLEFRHLLLPKPRINNWLTFNQTLLRRCDALHRDRNLLHKTLLWEAEKEKLIALPQHRQQKQED